MNLSSEQETQLQDYLVEQLEPICAADPKVLSMYILALIKRDDMSTEQVREFCTTELQDFLKEETKPFIGRLFDMLHEMTSRQSGGGVKKEMDDSRRHRERRGEDFDNEDGAYDQYEDRSSSSSRRSDDSRKRRSDQGERERDRSPAPYDDDSRDRKRRRAGSEEVEERSPSSQRRDRHRRDRDREDTRDVLPSSSSSSSTSTSSSRRGYDQRGHEAGGRVNIDRPLSSSRGKDEIAGGGGRWEGGREDSRSHPSASGSSRYDDGRGSRDYGSSRSRTGGRDTRPGGDFGGGRITGRKRGVCYDFEERGVCVKGESCEYEHLGRPLVVDEAGLSKLQSDREDTEEAGAYNPEDPFLNKTSPIPVWHGPTSRAAPPVPRGGRGVAGPGLLNPPMLPLPPMPHPQRLGNQGVLPLPSVPMLPPHQMPYHGGDGLMPTPGSQPYPSRGMRGMRGRGRGGYHQRPSYEDEGMFRTETESAITDTANFGGNRPPYDSHYGDNQGGGRGFNRFKRGRYEGDYGHRGARPPKPQTDSICVARIPQELNTISQLNAHFQKFGNIVNIQLDPANKQAFVQFTSNAEALLALRSPEAVMNNRFIQVYLKKDEAQEGGAPAPVVPQPPRPAVRPVPTSTVPQPAMMSRTPTSLVVQPAATAAAQPKNLELKKKQQELLSKQLEQQKKLLQLLEKMKGTTSKEKDEVKAQLTALTAKIGEAMKKAREGVAKQTVAPVVGAASTAATSWKKLSADSEKQRLDRELELLAKSKAATETSTNGVSAKSTTSEAGASLVKSPELSAAASPLPAPTKEADQSRMEALQKTLASLQEEAKQLGIPASQIAAQVTGVPSLSGPRGRGVGMRARAAPWWGRGRGRGGRGRGFASAPRSFKLDNRTTVVCVHDVPQELRDEALLRAHFQAFGEVISLAMQPDSNNFLVQFTQRFMAEQAMQKGTALQGHILNMSWHDSTQSAGEAGDQLELADTEAENQEEVEEYQGGETFVEEPFAVAEEEIDIDEDKEERSWKRE